MDDQGSQKARRGTLRAVAASGSLTKHSSSKILDSAPFNDKKRPAPVEGGRSTKNDGEQESDEDDRAASESTAVAQQGRSKRPRVHVEGKSPTASSHRFAGRGYVSMADTFQVTTAAVLARQKPTLVKLRGP